MKGLRVIRQERGLSLADLERMTEIDANTFSRYERGIVTPSVETADKIAKTLGVTVEELLRGPSNDKTRIILSYDWKEYEEGEVNMDGKLFKLFLGDEGQIGAKGSTFPKSRAEFEEFKTNLIQDLEDMFELQEKRLRRVGIQPA